jgi:hypothetical protein
MQKFWTTALSPCTLATNTRSCQYVFSAERGRSPSAARATEQRAGKCGSVASVVTAADEGPSALL